MATETATVTWPGADKIKRFSSLMTMGQNKLECLSLASPILASKADFPGAPLL